MKHYFNYTIYKYKSDGTKENIFCFETLYNKGKEIAKRYQTPQGVSLYDLLWNVDWEEETTLSDRYIVNIAKCLQDMKRYYWTSSLAHLFTDDAYDLKQKTEELLDVLLGMDDYKNYTIKSGKVTKRL